MIRVAIIDDHVVVRAGLRYIIEADPELEFVAEFGGGLGAADFVMFNAPDVVLLDVRMPDRNGIDALRDILKVNPAARVIMLTTSDAEEDVFRAIEEGALGYVMKDSEIEVISAAIRSAMAGEVYMTDDVRKIYETRKGSKGLSTREAQVLKLAATGGNNKEIAKEMGLSENSVKMFLKRAFYKLGASNRAEAVQLAVKRGLIEAGFTLIELLVVTVVVAILASIIFRLVGSVEDKEPLQTTIIRMQKLENCLSGYYAAFGCYPPVPLQGRSRNPFYRPLDDMKQGPLIQEVDRDPEYGVYDYRRVKSACQAQPVKAEFNYSQNDLQIVEGLNKFIQERMARDPDYAKAFKDWTAGTPFGPNDGSGSDSVAGGGRGGAKSQSRWRDLQKFKFGLMSFLVPRYLLMMGCEEDDAFNYYQWDGNNSRPCRFDTGVPYETWSLLNNLLKGPNRARNQWQVELIPSQAVTQRWLPNLEGICTYGAAPLKLYGITLTPSDAAGAMGMDPQHPEFISELVYPVNGGTGRMNNFLTVQDGWKQDFFYYSPPPYQHYRLWSAGKNMLTFPPWFTPEEMKQHNEKIMTYKVLYESGTIRVKEAVADDIVHLSH